MPLQPLYVSVLVVALLVLFASYSSHILSSLIVLEFLVLLIYFSVIESMATASAVALLLTCLFVITVSSAALGLAVLVPMTRAHSSDVVSSHTLLW